MKLIKHENQTFARCLFYGAAGSGKTTLLGTAMNDERSAPSLHIDCFGNTVSLRNNKKPPLTMSCDTREDLNFIYDHFANDQPELSSLNNLWKQTKASEGKALPRFKTLCFDGVSGLQFIAQSEITGNKDRKPGDTLAPMKLQDWGTLLTLMDKFAASFFGLPKIHVLVTALERVDEEELTKVREWSPALGGQSVTILPAYAYAVGRVMRLNRINPTAQAQYSLTSDIHSITFFEPLGKFVAKDQYGGFDQYVADLTMTKLLDMIERSNNPGRQG